MANDEFEALLDQVQNGSTFEALRAATQLNRLSRQRRKSTDELLRDAVETTADVIRQKNDADVDEIVRDVQQRARSPK
ncbi:MAG: hypothetical protein QOK37_222 [Thermoanaerobaculia bacterium]|jgi:hypothetical protein|nr:hypothetical protein [Thermoanaerobaculia bacterium]